MPASHHARFFSPLWLMFVSPLTLPLVFPIFPSSACQIFLSTVWVALSDGNLTTSYLQRFEAKTADGTSIFHPVRSIVLTCMMLYYNIGFYIYVLPSGIHCLLFTVTVTCCIEKKKNTTNEWIAFDRARLC
jgi:hypothetical protein